jgi:hypothetical protein
MGSESLQEPFNVNYIFDYEIVAADEASYGGFDGRKGLSDGVGCMSVGLTKELLVGDSRGGSDLY